MIQVKKMIFLAVALFFGKQTICSEIGNEAFYKVYRNEEKKPQGIGFCYRSRKGRMCIGDGHKWVTVKNVTSPNVKFGRLNEVTVANSQLPGANFKGQHLLRVNFKDSDLSGADFSGSTLELTDFDDVNLKNAKGLDSASIVRRVDFSNARNMPIDQKMAVRRKGAIVTIKPDETLKYYEKLGVNPWQ